MGIRCLVTWPCGFTPGAGRAKKSTESTGKWLGKDWHLMAMGTNQTEEMNYAARGSRRGLGGEKRHQSAGEGDVEWER